MLVQNLRTDLSLQSSCLLSTLNADTLSQTALNDITLIHLVAMGSLFNTRQLVSLEGKEKNINRQLSGEADVFQGTVSCSPEDRKLQSRGQ